MAAAAADDVISIAIFFCFFFLLAPAAASDADADALLRFKSTVSGSARAALSDWTTGTVPCDVSGRSNWSGVICVGSVSGSGIYGLQLEGMNLTGPLNLDPLAELKDLRTLSLKNNELAGAFPESLKKLGALKSLYLSNNRFSGDIPAAAFDGMGSMKKVHLSKNNFTGKIPGSLSALPKLVELKLDGNRFSGEIPELRQPDLKVVDFSNNELAGPIPESMRKMKVASFAGNKALCGPPLGESCPPAPPSASKSKNKLSTPVIIVVIVAALFVLAGLFAIITKRRQKQPTGEHQQHQMSSNKADSDAGDRAEQRAAGKLVFLREDDMRFEMQDLLKASAEVIGDGGFGSCFKATLGPATVVVVKRFTEMNGAGREDFAEHMRRLGRLSHQNLLPILAYYFRREEKLLVSNFVANGSLAQALHGVELQIDWLSRLRIINGVANGLAYLYQELPMLGLPHGRLKSSTVLIGGDGCALLTDYALAPMIDKPRAPKLMAAYNSPELAGASGKPTQKCDVWSLGILILEVLTGRRLDDVEMPPEKMVMWVKSVAREEWSVEVFDAKVSWGTTKRCEGGMMKLLQIGLDCCEKDAGKRPDMAAAAARIEGLKEEDGGGAGEREIYEDSREEMSCSSSRDDFSSFSAGHGSR